jgi:hypothetical protein
VWPDGFKVAYTKGTRTVVVVEQKPQVRTVSFTPDLLSSQNVLKEAHGSTENGYRFSLAFPFVYFVIVFDSGKYAYHEVYFRNKSLTSVREHIYLAPLPNVWNQQDKRQRAMCMGNGFSKEVLEELTIARQCELVISEFWQRTFNNDLGGGGQERIDKRIRNYAEWQKHSEEDSLFILTVQWPQGKTIKGVIESAIENRQQKVVDSVDNHIRSLLVNGVAKVGTRVKAEINNAKAKLKPLDLDKEAKAILEGMLVGHSRKVFDQCAARVNQQ